MDSLGCLFTSICFATVIDPPTQTRMVQWICLFDSYIFPYIKVI